MPSIKPFEITLGDINFLIDQMRDAIKIVRYDAIGRPIYGYIDIAGVSHELGLFGAFDPLAVTDAVSGLSIYDGAREASGFRLPVGFFNNLVSTTSSHWGATADPFPRLTAADYNNYVHQSLTNPALTTYEAAHLTFVPVADNSANYADLNKTVVDYTPRMITQTISSSYGDHADTVADSALTRMGVATDTITELVTARDGTTSTQTENIVRNVNTLPGDPSTSGIFTVFGQFFDHGLDFIDKGGQGAKIVIPLDPNDPLYRAPGTQGPQDPGNTTIAISRATPDGYTFTDLHGRPVSIAGADGTWGTADDVSPGADGVYGTADDTHALMIRPAAQSYTNHTSPYIDQSQSYGSDTQTTNLLREWIKDPNTGVYRPGAELLDGHRTQAYNSQFFNDASATGLGVGTTTRTVPTLNELREHIRDTLRADLTWDDINNLRARDDHGQVIDTNGAALGGYVYTGEAVLLDMNPRFDAERLQPNDGNASTVWDSNETGKVNTAIAYMNAHMGDVGRSADVLGFGINPQTGLNELKLTLGSPLDMGPGGILPAGTVLHGAYALAPWVNFANFSITVTDAGFYDAVGEIMMSSVGDHYIAGDGRANENFGLTALHHVFHENHNVQLLNLENAILSSPNEDARHSYQLAVSDGNGGFFHDQAGNYTLNDQSAVAKASSDQISWDPDKMFEATKLINEMEYQHVAIDQYARLVTPDLPEFVTYDSDINADISLEYSQAAFRFGHSQLRETIDAIDPNGIVTKYALEGAFLNPEQFAKVGASDILRGMSQQVSNEVDEFVTPAMQQTLLGQPLDLAAINIARGRDVGMPTLNEVRRQLHDALVAERAADPTTPHHTNLIVDALNPYTSWAEFGSQMQHPESLVDFIAAYSFDGDVSKAQELIDLETGVITSGTHGYTIDDAIQFLNNSYTGINTELSSGQGAFNNIDFWIGGLAEQHVFTGQLGTTFNAIFEDQMERLMDGDRFYYLYRLQDALNIDTDLGHAIVTEQFKDIIERTTGVQHLNGDVMGYSDSTLELARKIMPGTALLAVRGQDILDISGNHVVANQGDLQYDASHNLITQDFRTAHAYGDMIAVNDANGIHMGIYSGVGGGTAGNGTTLHKSNTDLGFVNQAYIADFRPDTGENPDGTPASGYNSHETLAGTDYNDWIDAGNGDDTVYGDKGDDVLDGKAGADHLYGGDGQDVLYGGDIEDFLDGGAGDDIIYAGTSAGALDVVIGGAGNDKLYGEAGIDEIYGGSGDDYIDAGGDTDLAFGDAGNDIMFGGDGPDELRGGLGDDMLSGGSGADVLKGEGGDDLLFGGIGQNAQNGDSDELLGDVGFDSAVFSDTNIVLDTAADLRNQNLVAAGGATPFNPFSQLWADLEGVIGSKFADKIIGDDSENWLIGGGGDDTFGTRVANTDGIVGSGGNDVIIGGHIRLDTLIGTYGGYANGFDVNGNATHGVTGTLTGGLLDNATLGTTMFAKHYTDLLMTEHNKDLVLGGDSGPEGTSDTVVFSGNKADYTITAISYTSAHEGPVVAYKVTDNGGLNSDGTARAPSDGTDLIIGVDYLQFRDQTVSLNNTPPVLDLHAYNTTSGSYADNFNSASFNNSTGSTLWTASYWSETGDLAANPITSGQIQLDTGDNANHSGGTNDLRFIGGATSDGASIQRTVNLAGASTATISYTFDQNNIDPGETVTVQFSADGTFNPATLQNIQVITNTSGNFSGSGSTSVALNGPFSANSAIRFVASAISATNEDVRIDNLNISFTTKTPVNDLSNDYQTTYTEGGASVRIASGPSITDDGTQILSARIVLTNAVAGDALNRNDIAGDGITGMTDTSVPGQITVNLTGAASFAAYQNAIEAITFSSNSNNPTNADRVIHVTVNDGLVDSNVATTAVHVVPVNDPPNAGDENVISNFASGTSYTVPGWALLANDTDTDGPGPLTLTNVTESSSNFTAVLTAGNVVVTDSSNGSRSFTYTVSDGASPTAGTDTNSVSVTRDTTGTVDGNNSNTPDILVGDGASSTFDAGTGDDIVFGGGGDDTIVWNANTFGSTDGHDFVDGGSNTAIGDRAVITGNNSSETFRIYSNTDDWDNNALNGIESSAAHAGLTGLNASTEIVITRTVGNSTSVIAELDNVEEITINTRDVTANDGGGLNGGNVGNDTIQVFGNFSSTSLNYSTITINGDNGDDTVDITGLTSDHRIVFHGGGGSDHVEGTVRPQDVVDNQSGPPAGDDPSVPPGDDQQDQDSGDQQDDGNDATQVPLAHLGTDADDVMIGTLDDDVLAGVGGDDLILGDSGADTLKGGSGDDLVKGGAGDDVILGNEGNDDLFGGSGNDLMTGDAGDDRLFGDAGDDVLEGGAGSDTVYGGADNDRIVAKAGDGDDTYFGDTGEDTLDYSAISANIAADLGNGLMQHGSVSSSQSGTDATFGFENFVGGSGNDTITASSVANVMDGGGGNDTYVFHSAADADGDTIKGFQPGDKIDLSAIDANTGASGTQSFVLFAGNMFTSAGQVIVTQELKEGVEHTFVEGNTNNDTVADFKIDLGAGNQALTAADFNGVH